MIICEDDGMARRYLSRTEVADRIGVTSSTLSRYKLPPPDVIVGGTRGWTEATIDRWNAARPGPSAKLTPEQRATITARLAAGEVGARLAVEYGVTESAVSRLRARVVEATWGDVRPGDAVVTPDGRMLVLSVTAGGTVTLDGPGGDRIRRRPKASRPVSIIR